MKVAILGEQKSIMIFKALGLDLFPVSVSSDVEEAKQILEKEEYAILFITEEIAEKYQEQIDSLYNKVLPAVLVLPSKSSGDAELKKIMERALGSSSIEL